MKKHSFYGIEEEAVAMTYKGLEKEDKNNIGS